MVRPMWNTLKMHFLYPNRSAKATHCCVTVRFGAKLRLGHFLFCHCEVCQTTGKVRKLQHMAKEKCCRLPAVILHLFWVRHVKRKKKKSWASHPLFLVMG